MIWLIESKETTNCSVFFGFLVALITAIFANYPAKSRINYGMSTLNLIVGVVMNDKAMGAWGE